MRNLALAALLAGTIATPAFAQQPQPQGGFRIEGLVGYDRANIEDEGTDGVVYGVGAGYDFQAGRALIGVEAEATDSTADECVGDVVIQGDALCVGAGRDLYVGGRVGALVGNNVLLYGKAGYTNARVSLDYDDGTASTTADLSDHTNLDGVRVGGGAQVGLTANTYVRTEYRYSNYQDGVDRHQLVGGVGFRF